MKVLTTINQLTFQQYPHACIVCLKGSNSRGLEIFNYGEFAVIKNMKSSLLNI